MSFTFGNTQPNIVGDYQNLYHGVRLRQRVHTVTISRSTVTHAERLPIEPQSIAHTMGNIGGRVVGYT